MVIGNRLGSQKAANLRNASKHLLISVLPQDKQEKKKEGGREEREKKGGRGEREIEKGREREIETEGHQTLQVGCNRELPHTQLQDLECTSECH